MMDYWDFPKCMASFPVAEIIITIERKAIHFLDSLYCWKNCFLYLLRLFTMCIKMAQTLILTFVFLGARQQNEVSPKY